VPLDKKISHPQNQTT